jgi:hypothetical protein
MEAPRGLDGAEENRKAKKKSERAFLIIPPSFAGPDDSIEIKRRLVKGKSKIRAVARGGKATDWR